MSSDEWCTPQVVLDRVLRLKERIDCDPCWNPGALTDPRHACVAEPESCAEMNTVAGIDGLAADWCSWEYGSRPDRELVYVNPPYSALGVWANKIVEQRTRHELEIVSLVPAYTDTGWWRTLVWSSADVVAFWNGRLKFLEGGKEKTTARFPSAVVYHGHRPEIFEKAFADAAKVVFP